MKPEEKAKELVEKFTPISNTVLNDDVFADYNKTHGEGKKRFLQVVKHSQLYHAKQCALIAVDLILNESRPDEGFIYWQEVKQEINKL